MEEEGDHRARIFFGSEQTDQPLVHRTEFWRRTTDFKGQFPTRDGQYCYPLTIVDYHSRYLLACAALPSVCTAGTRPIFERVFREVGLPAAIQSDNGTPFCSTGLRGLSALNVWWIRLGIRPVRIEPSHPEQNGAHERMHRTLKAETTRPPAVNRRGQQRKFEAFRYTCNHERPHEALGQPPPARRWHPSGREYPRALPAPDYPGWSAPQGRLASGVGKCS